MTNMPPEDDFHPFGIVTAIICLPTYMLIGSLNTTSGLQFWTHKTRTFFTWVGMWLASVLALVGYEPSWTHKHLDEAGSTSGECDEVTSLIFRNGHLLVMISAGKPGKQVKLKSQSASDGMAARGGFGPLSPQWPLLSPQTTIENTSRLTAPTNFNSTIKIDASNRPRSFVEKNEVQESRNSSGSGAELSRPRTGSESRSSWLPSRLLNRKSIQESDDREFC